MSNRPVFEDVGDARAGPSRQRDARPAAARAGIFAWLMVLACLVAAMVLLGGATRLTDSGLSITEWAPVMGALPPLSDADWERAFAAYRETTEFKTQNRSMTLDAFKVIFWWEWGHRLLGRLIGLVWLAGFVFFLVRRRIPDGWTGRLLLVGALGGLQGAVGWWMVASGLVGRVDVAPYRLAAHLGLAFAIFGLLIWYALRIRMDPVETLQRRRNRDAALMPWTGWMGVLLFVQVLLGALVAGLDAGRGFVDWPLMLGQIFPEGAFSKDPWWVNFFENEGLTQFNHRVAAYLLVLLSVPFALRLGRAGHARIRARGYRLAAIVLAQAALGVVTLMNAAPFSLALAHQALALVLFGALVQVRFEVAYPSEQRITV